MPISSPVSQSAPTTTDQTACPVIITGIMPRSGTNYLHRLLSLHPDCSPLQTGPVKEDFLLHHANHLSDYADHLAWQWGHWGDAGPSREDVLLALGDGLAGFLEPAQPAKYVITKTPSVRNIDQFFSTFSDARLLILVRDGRSVVASGMAGFDWDFEWATRRWADAARTVAQCQEKYGAQSERHLILRYEDLNDDPETLLTQVFSFFQVSPDAYDFSEALDLPVYGSSFSKNESNEVTWQPQPKTQSFGSEERWSSWSDARHDRFNWLAGDELRELDYVPKTGSNRAFNRLRHIACDARYEAVRFPRRLRRSLRSGVNSFASTFKTRF